MTTDVTYSNLESGPYNLFYDILNNRTNLPDPRGSTATSRQFILDADPVLHKSMAFSGPPYVVLEPPTLVWDKISVDGRFKFANWKQRIIVRTARDGSGNNRADVGRTDILTIGDNLQNLFNNLTIKQSIFYAGISKSMITKLSTDIVTIDQKQMFEAVYELEYENRFMVTSV